MVNIDDSTQIFVPLHSPQAVLLLCSHCVPLFVNVPVSFLLSHCPVPSCQHGLVHCYTHAAAEASYDRSVVIKCY